MSGHSRAPAAPTQNERTWNRVVRAETTMLSPMTYSGGTGSRHSTSKMMQAKTQAFTMTGFRVTSGGMIYALCDGSRGGSEHASFKPCLPGAVSAAPALSNEQVQGPLATTGRRTTKATALPIFWADVRKQGGGLPTFRSRPEWRPKDGSCVGGAAEATTS